MLLGWRPFFDRPSLVFLRYASVTRSRWSVAFRDLRGLGSFFGISANSFLRFGSYCHNITGNAVAHGARRIRWRDEMTTYAIEALDVEIHARRVALIVDADDEAQALERAERRMWADGRGFEFCRLHARRATITEAVYPESHGAHV